MKPHVNLQSIRFGSDKLTLGVVRKLEPEKFDGQLTPELGPYDKITSRDPWETINTIMRNERKLAELSYARAIEGAGRDRDPWRDETRSELFRNLIESYTRYGIACDNVHAQALLGDIEREAAAQAKANRKGPFHSRF
jgi:hypothetical protein